MEATSARNRFHFIVWWLNHRSQDSRPEQRGNSVHEAVSILLKHPALIGTYNYQKKAGQQRSRQDWNNNQTPFASFVLYLLARAGATREQFELVYNLDPEAIQHWKKAEFIRILEGYPNQGTVLFLLDKDPSFASQENVNGFRLHHRNNMDSLGGDYLPVHVVLQRLKRNADCDIERRQWLKVAEKVVRASPSSCYHALFGWGLHQQQSDQVMELILQNIQEPIHSFEAKAALTTREVFWLTRILPDVEHLSLPGFAHPDASQDLLTQIAQNSQCLQRLQLGLTGHSKEIFGSLVLLQRALAECGTLELVKFHFGHPQEHDHDVLIVSICEALESRSKPLESLIMVGASFYHESTLSRLLSSKSATRRLGLDMCDMQFGFLETGGSCSLEELSMRLYSAKRHDGFIKSVLRKVATSPCLRILNLMPKDCKRDSDPIIDITKDLSEFLRKASGLQELLLQGKILEVDLSCICDALLDYHTCFLRKILVNPKQYDTEGKAIDVDLIWQTIAYYQRLNACGRSIAKDPRTTKDAFVELILCVPTNESTSLRYSLLRENPALWANESAAAKSMR